jgi:asparagine synthase (glutamine-hydrolysing)
MCGIAGIIHPDQAQEVDGRQLRKMADRIKHRGPDDSGIETFPGVGLAHRRLSIIDLSSRGHQPMSNSDGSVCIVFNGEIYNFKQLRSELESKGYKFKSDTDTEVLIHGYQEHGDDVVLKLRGMFAFAIYDLKRHRLLLARDRLGKKPLKYMHKNGSLYFASELKALLTLPEVSREIDATAIDQYLTYQYVPSPRTGFKAIAKLPAAHRAVWENGNLKIERYWQQNYLPKKNISMAEAVEGFHEVFLESVKLRLISDVPLGAFLSGGLDSSAIVAAMSEVGEGAVRTFTIGFDDGKFDERPHAKKVAERFGTTHREFLVKPDALDIFPKLVDFYEEPYADSSALPSYYLAKMTRQEVTVALNGDGGDENFAGYRTYQHYAKLMAAGKLRLPMFTRPLAQLACELTGMASPRAAYQGDFLMRLLRTPAPSRYPELVAYFSRQGRSDMYSADFHSRLDEVGGYSIMERALEQARADNAVERAMAADLCTYLPDDLLVKVDIASMANSLECRSPLLDHKLMEYVATLPLNMKIVGNNKKVMFKEYLKQYLPPELLTRRKQGFGIPMDRWFRDELKTYSRDLLLGDGCRLNNMIRKEYLLRLLDQHACGRRNHGKRIWALLTLEQWLRGIET